MWLMRMDFGIVSYRFLCALLIFLKLGSGKCTHFFP